MEGGTRSLALKRGYVHTVQAIDAPYGQNRQAVVSALVDYVVSEVSFHNLKSEENQLPVVSASAFCSGIQCGNLRYIYLLE